MWQIRRVGQRNDVCGAFTVSLSIGIINLIGEDKGTRTHQTFFLNERMELESI
jgi:hypothetical protein